MANSSAHPPPQELPLSTLGSGISGSPNGVSFCQYTHPLSLPSASALTAASACKTLCTSVFQSISIQSFLFQVNFLYQSIVTQSCPTLCDPLPHPTWTSAHQALLSMEFSRQGYWSRLPFPSPGDLPDLGIKPGSPASQADALPSELPGKPYIFTCTSPNFKKSSSTHLEKEMRKINKS